MSLKKILTLIVSTIFIFNISVAQQPAKESGFYANIGLGYLNMNDHPSSDPFLDLKAEGGGTIREKLELGDKSGLGMNLGAGYAINQYIAVETGVAISLTPYKFLQTHSDNDNIPSSNLETRIFNIYLMPKLTYQLKKFPLKLFIQAGASYTIQGTHNFLVASTPPLSFGLKPHFVSIAYGAGIEYQIKQLPGITIGLTYMGFYSQGDELTMSFEGTPPPPKQDRLKINLNYILVTAGYKF